MKKPEAGVNPNKSRAKLVTRHKQENVLEAGLKARSAKAVRAITIGSAALGIISLSLFAVNKFRKKRNWFS